jgi:hypothetical protein
MCSFVQVSGKNALGVCGWIVFLTGCQMLQRVSVDWWILGGVTEHAFDSIVSGCRIDGGIR